MRPRDVLLPVLLAALAAGGCSRLTFIKTDPDRRSYEETNAPIEVHESAAAKRRAELRNQVALAQSALLKDDLDAAERAARQALKIDGASPDPQTLLAAIAERRGRMVEAGGLYRRAAELAPQDGAVANNYGAWLCANGRAAESLSWFDRALQDPAYATPAAALANAGACALRAGQADRAGRDLRRAVVLDDENAVALGALAQLEYQSGRYMEARAFSERRLAAAPADAGALVLASQIERKLGDSAAAARYGRRLREEFPGNASGSPGDATQR